MYQDEEQFKGEALVGVRGELVVHAGQWGRYHLANWPMRFGRGPWHKPRVWRGMNSSRGGIHPSEHSAAVTIWSRC